MRNTLAALLACFALLCAGLATESLCTACDALLAPNPYLFLYAFGSMLAYIIGFTLFGLTASKLSA